MGKFEPFGALPHRIGAFLQRGGGRWLTVCLILVALGAYGAWQLWLGVAPYLVAQPQYRISPEEIEVTRPPAWVSADVKGETLRAAGLGPTLSLLDPELGRTLHRAFALHPWVRNARVVKFPGGVRVELEYRRAVLLVALRDNWEPVDVDGVRLPAAGLPLDAMLQLPRLANLGSFPVGPVGAPWGDPRVPAAARIAETLTTAWPKLGLAYLEAAPNPGPTTSSNPLFYIFTASRRTRVIWGHAPGGDSNEPTPDEKLARLEEHRVQHGGLEAPEGAYDLDLRASGQVLVTPRVAGGSGERK